MEWVSLEDSMFTEWATTQYIFCNRLKYCLPLCRVIIISQISLVIGYFCKARVRAVFQNDFLFSLDKMFQLKCIWRDIVIYILDLLFWRELEHFRVEETRELYFNFSPRRRRLWFTNFPLSSGLSLIGDILVFLVFTSKNAPTALWVNPWLVEGYWWYRNNRLGFQHSLIFG